MDVTAAEFLISGGSLLMLAADAGGTLRLFSYDQKSPASARGSRLLPLCAACPHHCIPLCSPTSGDDVCGAPPRNELHERAY